MKWYDVLRFISIIGLEVSMVFDFEFPIPVRIIAGIAALVMCGFFGGAIARLP